MDNNNFNNRFPKTDGSGNGREAQSLPSNSSRDGIEGGGTDNEFPGYPHYPASEDIMNPANQVQRVAVDVENLAPTGSVGKKPDNANPSGSFTSAQNATDDELKIVPGTDADVTGPGRDMGERHRRSRAGDAGQIVVLRHPIAPVAQRLDMPREVE